MSHSGLTFEDFHLAAVVTDLARAEAADRADAVEFRMDRATAPLEQLKAYEGNQPIIATNRAQWEGGDADDHNRLRTLLSASRYPAVSAIDVELKSVNAGAAGELRAVAAANDVSVIVSWHDFDHKPDRPTLKARLRRAGTWGDVGKLAVTATSPDDVLDLLAVTRTCTREGIRVATMSMGAPGRHSRVIAPLYGSKIGYAPLVPEEATAPGQYPLEQMASLIDQLR